MFGFCGLPRDPFYRLHGMGWMKFADFLKCQIDLLMGLCFRLQIDSWIILQFEVLLRRTLVGDFDDVLLTAWTDL